MIVLNDSALQSRFYILVVNDGGHGSSWIIADDKPVITNHWLIGGFLTPVATLVHQGVVQPGFNPLPDRATCNPMTVVPVMRNLV